MSDLEETAIAFLRAMRATGKDCFGHDRFGFKIDVKTMAMMEDSSKAESFNAKVQEALSRASQTVQSVTIEGTSLQ